MGITFEWDKRNNNSGHSLNCYYGLLAPEKQTMKRGLIMNQKETEMLDNYDFSKGVRGKYAKRYAEGNNIVVLSPDVAAFFPDSQSVNDALRALIKIAKRKESKMPVVTPHLNV